MPLHHGKSGVVRVGNQAVTEVVGFKVDHRYSTGDTTVMGDAAESHLGGVEFLDAEVNCLWDEGNTQGQQALVVGASITLNLYPEGTGSGATYFSGVGTVVSRGLVAEKDGIVQRSIQVKGNGALSELTV